MSARTFSSRIVVPRAVTLADRLRQLRVAHGYSQEEIGRQGFVSTPGWIKLENGQRSPSEALIGKLVGWLTESKYVKKGEAVALRDELLTLKYLGSNQPFVRRLAGNFARATVWGQALLAATAPAKTKRGRPQGTQRREVAAR